MALRSPSLTAGLGVNPSQSKPGRRSTGICNASAVPAPNMLLQKTPTTPKLVWVWTKTKEVMMAAVERGWDTFLFQSDAKVLADDWKSIAFFHPLFVEESEVVDKEHKNVAFYCTLSSPEQLKSMQPDQADSDKVVVNLEGGWQVIPAENIVAAFHGSGKTVIAIASTFDEARIFLEALEQGLGGVVLRVENVSAVFRLKEYFDRITMSSDRLTLVTTTITKVQVVGMGDRVCVDLCSIMRPGEGILVGSFARGLFLVHSECLDTNYIASRPFRVNAGPVHAYVAVPGGKTCYLSELKAGSEVIVVSESGKQRIATVGRVKIEARQLILVEAKAVSGSEATYSIFLQNAETVGLVCPSGEEADGRTMVPVTSLKVGDQVLLRVQGGARHTGIEIQEFILEK